MFYLVASILVIVAIVGFLPKLAGGDRFVVGIASVVIGIIFAGATYFVLLLLGLFLYPPSE